MFYYKKGVMIDKDFTLRLSIMKAEEQSSICAIDTILRIDEPEEKLYTCSNCVFNDTIVCPSKIRTLIDYESVLV